MPNLSVSSPKILISLDNFFKFVSNKSLLFLISELQIFVKLLTYDADEEGNVGVFQSLFYDEEDEIFKFIADDIKQFLKKK